MGEWQPIHKAPPFAVPVLTYGEPRYGFSGKRMAICYFVTGQGWLEASLPPSANTAFSPTHWMPLPEPPSPTPEVES